jgi:hypothetical protein
MSISPNDKNTFHKIIKNLKSTKNLKYKNK